MVVVSTCCTSSIPSYDSLDYFLPLFEGEKTSGEARAPKVRRGTRATETVDWAGLGADRATEVAMLSIRILQL